ncbi:MAG TPA: DUF6624 domain-containing protein [Vicinamibacterales bacterium]
MLNPTLRAELLEMRAADLRLRQELVRDGSLFDGYNERMAELHRRQNARLALLLAEHGWPGRALVNEDGAAAAWLLLQHAILDPPLMRGAVPLLERAVEAHDADSRHLAFLVDRIRTMEGKPQLYGTSHDWDAAGQLSPVPIEEPAAVDERRRHVGLEPLAENTRRLRAQAEAEGEGPPADYEARRRESEAWARATGWRSGE